MCEKSFRVVKMALLTLKLWKQGRDESHKGTRDQERLHGWGEGGGGAHAPLSPINSTDQMQSKSSCTLKALLVSWSIKRVCLQLNAGWPWSPKLIIVFQQSSAWKQKAFGSRFAHSDKLYYY